MRSKLIATLTAILLAVGVMAAFQSAPAYSSVSSASAAKVKHELKIIDAGEVGNKGRFFVKGKVKTAPKKFVKLDRRLPGKARKAFKKTKANKRGAFTFQFDGPVGTTFWVVAPSSNGYKKAQIRIGTICREPC